MGLRVVLDAVELRISDVVGAAGGPMPNFQFGVKGKYIDEAPPRITWVPVQGRVTPADQHSGSRIRNPRQLWTRNLQIQSRIWTESYEDTEALAQHVLAAFTAEQYGSYTPISEEWDTTGVLEQGCLAVFVIELRLPFVDETLQTIQPTAAPVTGQPVTS